MSDDDDVDDLMVDILDRGGRLRRFLFALSVGVAIAIGTGSAVYRYVDDAPASPYHTPHVWKTVFYVAALAGGAAFALTATLLSWLRARRERANILPRARVRK